MIWFTSDTHFDHANIIEFCGRPFANVEEMNETMVAKWNARVKPEDEVYHLGDFAMGPATNIGKFRERLNGEIILIRGNHDRSEARMLSFGFKAALPEAYFPGGALHLLLTHRPARESMDRPPFDVNLHGHVHEKWARRDKHVNVGVDVRDFEPKTLEELLA